MKKEGWILICLFLVFLTGLIAFNLGYMENEPSGVTIYGNVSMIGSERSEESSAAEKSTASDRTASDSTSSEKETAASSRAVSSDAGFDLPSLPAESENINTASLEALLTVEGMTQSTAEEILRFRARAGKFTDLRELRNVKGVSAKLADKIAERFYCE